MFLRYLKAQAIVLLCGGLVGPIFLAVYFALGTMSRPSLQWMFWIGLFITAIDVLAALALANYGAKSEAQTDYLEQQGVLALAQITAIAETGVRINDEPLVKISLHISGPGLVPFDAEDRVRASVTQLPVITGRKMVVLVDPRTGHHQIDWQRSAVVSGVVPAEFTLDEDGTTYDLSGQSGPLMEIMRVLHANHVPVAGAIDIRSNPVVRQQVMDIVRRSATAPPPAPVMFTPAPLTVSQRLQELDTLHATGSITEAEYTTKRQEILSEL